MTGPMNVVRDLRTDVLPDGAEAPVLEGLDGVSSPNDAVIGGEGVDVAVSDEQSAARQPGPIGPTPATNPYGGARRGITPVCSDTEPPPSSRRGRGRGHVQRRLEIGTYSFED